MLRVITFNLNGIRSAFNKGFGKWMDEQNADVICLQELKAQEADMVEHILKPHGYNGWFNCAEKKGYSGVGLYLRHQPLDVCCDFSIDEFDIEGRYLRADWKQLSVISVYLPSGSSSEERQQAKFRFLDAFYPHLASLRRQKREIIIGGDWNIAHQEIDLKNWKANQKNSGFLPEERAWMTRVLDELGWVDTYRHHHPHATGEGYTWWSNRGQARANNVGWRIDYQISTPGIAAKIHSASVWKTQRFSDHAPLIVDYDTDLPAAGPSRTLTTRIAPSKSP